MAGPASSSTRPADALLPIPLPTATPSAHADRSRPRRARDHPRRQFRPARARHSVHASHRCHAAQPRGARAEDARDHAWRVVPRRRREGALRLRGRAPGHDRARLKVAAEHGAAPSDRELRARRGRGPAQLHRAPADPYHAFRGGVRRLEAEASRPHTSRGSSRRERRLLSARRRSWGVARGRSLPCRRLRGSALTPIRRTCGSHRRDVVCARSLQSRVGRLAAAAHTWLDRDLSLAAR